MAVEVAATRGGCGGGHGYGDGRGGHGGQFSNIQCQICHKYGHEASYRYYRHDDNYVPTRPMNCPNQNQYSNSNQNPNQQWYSNQIPNQY